MCMCMWYVLDVHKDRCMFLLRVTCSLLRQLIIYLRIWNLIQNWRQSLLAAKRRDLMDDMFPSEDRLKEKLSRLSGWWSHGEGVRGDPRALDAILVRWGKKARTATLCSIARRSAQQRDVSIGGQFERGVVKAECVVNATSFLTQLDLLVPCWYITNASNNLLSNSQSLLLSSTATTSQKAHANTQKHTKSAWKYTEAYKNTQKYMKAYKSILYATMINDTHYIRIRGILLHTSESENTSKSEKT